MLCQKRGPAAAASRARISSLFLSGDPNTFVTGGTPNSLSVCLGRRCGNRVPTVDRLHLLLSVRHATSEKRFREEPQTAPDPDGNEGTIPCATFVHATSAASRPHSHDTSGTKHPYGRECCDRSKRSPRGR